MPWAYNFAALPAGTSRRGAPGDDRVVHHRRRRPARQRRPGRHLGLVRLGRAGHVPGHPGRGHAGPARAAVPARSSSTGRSATSRSTAPAPARAPSTCRPSRSTARATQRNWVQLRRDRRRRHAGVHDGRRAPSTWGTGAGDVPPSFNDGWHPTAGGARPGHQPGPRQAGDRLGRVRRERGSGRGVRRRARRRQQVVLDGRRHQVPPGRPRLEPERRLVRGQARRPGRREAPAGTPAPSTSRPAPTAPTWTTRGHRQRATARAARTIRSRRCAARYVRLNITTPANDGNGAARIDEFEVYGGGGGGPTNVALNKAATADSSCNANEGPAKAVNGSVSGGNTDKWCSLRRDQVLAGRPRARRSTIQSFTVRHAGAGGESTTWNTRDFTLQVSSNGTTWTTVVDRHRQHRQRHQPPHHPDQRALRPAEHHRPDPDHRQRRPHLRGGGLRVSASMELAEWLW